jgi:CRP-like cAMP-binding protein
MFLLPLYPEVIRCKMYKTLIEKINTVDHFSQQEIDFFTGLLTTQLVVRGEHFLKEGQICRYLGYVQSGLLMYYRVHNGTEIPTDFAIEGEWASYLDSFTNRTDSDLGIRALEDTIVTMLSASDFEKICRLHPKFIKLKDYYTQLSFVSSSRHAADLAMLDARERYHKFVSEKPELTRRIPQYYIAAYLGIKPQSLSRLRKSVTFRS